LAAFLQAAVLSACLAAETAKPVRGAAAVEAVENEAPAKIFVDPPLPEPLAHGRVVIQYRVENLHLVPVFGAAALAISPRVGHIHVSVDDASWVWVEASGEPVLLNGFTPGRHKVLLQLESANHQLLNEASVSFIVPEVQRPAAAAPATVLAAKLIIDSPLAEPLSRGVVFLPYRAENLRILPVFGRGALGVSPPIGHIHVTVDDAPWHWADASGVPVIVNGLPPGRHKILIELVNANHQRIDQGTVEITVPAH
jgi:hypothetical protein